MKPYPNALVLGSAIALTSLLYGCSTPPDSVAADPAPATEPAAEGSWQLTPAAGEPVSTVVDARPAALVDSRSLRWGDLRPVLTDAAGSLALRELIIDRRLAVTAEEARVAITEGDVYAEEQRLLETLSDDPVTAVRLRDELRDRQELGPVRYPALLRRNALLRALVRDQVEVTDAAVRQMYDVRHGAARQARLLTSSDLAAAQNAIDRVRGGAFLGDLAVELSTDASAARGGLLEPVSRLDPSYPATLRQAIWNLPVPGAISDPTLLDNGYAVVQLVREVPAEGPPLDEVRGDIVQLVRLNQERLLMDQLARSLLAGAQVTIFDDTLDASWKRYQRARRR